MESVKPKSRILSNYKSVLDTNSKERKIRQPLDKRLNGFMKEKLNEEKHKEQKDSKNNKNVFENMNSKFIF